MSIRCVVNVCIKLCDNLVHNHLFICFGSLTPLAVIIVSDLVKEPISKKCVIKGDNLCVTGPTKNLHILNAEWVLISVWGAVYLYLWEIYELP